MGDSSPRHPRPRSQKNYVILKTLFFADLHEEPHLTAIKSLNIN